MKKLFLLLLPLALFSQCRLEESTDENKRHHIVTTTGIIADGVNNIVGDSADVDFIMGPGTDPHIYKPTSMDVELLDEADIIISNGVHLEGKMAEMLDKYGQEKPVIRLGDGIPEDELIKVAEMDDAVDAHIWFDPMMWKDGLKYVSDELGKVDSKNKDYYADNFKTYAGELDKTSTWIEGEIESLPDSLRVLITSHDAFNYFGRRYNLDVRGIQGISTLSEVGLKDVANMVDFIVERKIKAIFTETGTSDKTAVSIQDGAREKGHEIVILGPLHADALGEPHSPAGTYIGMIKENVRMIVEGLSE